MAFLTEPPYAHGSFARIGILLINLGTPSAPTAVAVRSYLREFLSDPRVVEIPRALWNPILHGVILRTRPQRSAARYAAVWTKDGSPLQVYTARQAKLLQGVLGDRMKLPVVVEHAMRYGEPSIPTMLSRMRAAHVERLLVLPLYPQYAASTSASAVDALGGWLRRARNQPEVRVVKHFHDHPAYIAALGDSLRDFWRTRGRPDKLLMSFHGVPRFTLDRGDPYHCECQKTARLLAADLELPESAWHISFQSRFGRAEWLKPYTADTVSELARKGVRRLDVVCPGFVSDCLETLEEIALEAKALFLKSGGTEFNAIPCLNDRQGWIDALATIVRDHLGGWGAEGWNRAAADEAARASAARAKRLGAAT